MCLKILRNYKNENVKYIDLNESQMYSYKIQQANQDVEGCVYTVDIESIMPHEKIIMSKRVKYIKDIRRTNLLTRPLLVIKMGGPRHIEQSYDRHVMTFLKDGESIHSIYQANEKPVLDDNERYLIADGHHRYSALLELAQENSKYRKVPVFVVEHEAMTVSMMPRFYELGKKNDVKELREMLKNNFNLILRDKMNFNIKCGVSINIDEQCYILQSTSNLGKLAEITSHFENIESVLIQQLEYEHVDKFSNDRGFVGSKIKVCYFGINKEDIISSVLNNHLFSPHSTCFEPKPENNIFIYKY
jgi:uncharacterized protein (DUF1015 family)